MAEDCGESVVLRFGPRVPEHATDLEETRRLWDFLAGRRSSLRKKVLLITSAPGGLSPDTLDDFRDLVRRDQASRGNSPGATRADIELAREENAFRHFVETIRKLDCFVIAAIEGQCDFNFLGEALACDYRIATEDAVFVNRLFESETAPGVLPWFLTRLLGQAEAMDILLGGRSLTATEAYELRLVNKITPTDQLEKVSKDTARRFASIPKPALRAIKRSLVASSDNLGAYLDQIGAGFRAIAESPADGRR